MNERIKCSWCQADIVEGGVKVEAEIARVGLRTAYFCNERELEAWKHSLGARLIGLERVSD